MKTANSKKRPAVAHAAGERSSFDPAPLSLEDQAKAYRFLKYRGFNERAIQQVLNEKR